ncbi:conserved hypothetical protein [Ricinus communis]|uniref:Uncharacterized protein n=1 Tax=Ricinus communis TaxID=3988 RepID=B9SF41_RICCO|nr:conserved hypothetical protein [Ricinus communis]
MQGAGKNLGINIELGSIVVLIARRQSTGTGPPLDPLFQSCHPLIHFGEKAVQR